MNSPEEQNDISQVFGCRELAADVVDVIGDKEHSFTDLIAVGLMLSLRNNYDYDTAYRGDKLISFISNTCYAMKSVTVEDTKLLEEKMDACKQALFALNVHGAPSKYLSYVAWHYKYTSLMLKAISIYSANVVSSMDIRENFLQRLTQMLYEEFGYFNIQIILHALSQLNGKSKLYLDRIGSVLEEDVYISNIKLASKGAIVTKDLSLVIEAFNLPYARVEDVRDEIEYIYKQPMLSTMQMKLLMQLPYRDRLVILHKRLLYMCDHMNIAEEVAIVRKLGTYEWQHAFNVAVVSGLIAIELQVPTKEFNHILIGALLHDIGKSKVPKDILEAPRKLTASELQIVRQHPSHGAELLKGFHKTVVNIAAYHHACNDGIGYPPVTDIPKAATIVHIADIFDAMCRERDYKKPYDRSYVKQYILEHSTWFSEDVLNAFKRAVKIFVPGEIAFVSGNPCTFYDAYKDKYTFYVEELQQHIHFTEEELNTRLLWRGSIKA